MRLTQLIYLLPALLLFSSCGKGTSTEEVRTAYTLAMKNQDYVTATQMIYLQLAIDTGNIDLQDSLARLYYQRSAWPQTAAVGEKVLEARPNDTLTLKRVAEARQQLGQHEKALADFQRLYSMQKSANSLYQIAVLQYLTQDKPAALITVNQLLNAPSVKEEGTIVTFNDRGRAQSQVVSVFAAALNLRGVLLLEAENAEEAEESFALALQNAPNFVLAYNNLSQINQERANSIVQQAQEQALQQQRLQQQQGGQPQIGR
mgnify:CR=1 FL=1